MIPELEAIVQDLEAAMKGPSPERSLPLIVRRLTREVQLLRDRQNNDDHETHMWAAIHKIAAAANVSL